MYIVEGEANGFVTFPPVSTGPLSPDHCRLWRHLPQTPFGKALASLVMILGYGIIAVPTGIVTAEISKVGNQSPSSQACPACGADGHDNDAVHCKFCGSAFEQSLEKQERLRSEPGKPLQSFGLPVGRAPGKDRFWQDPCQSPRCRQYSQYRNRTATDAVAYWVQQNFETVLTMEMTSGKVPLISVVAVIRQNPTGAAGRRSGPPPDPPPGAAVQTPKKFSNMPLRRSQSTLGKWPRTEIFLPFHDQQYSQRHPAVRLFP